MPRNDASTRVRTSWVAVALPRVVIVSCWLRKPFAVMLSRMFAGMRIANSNLSSAFSMSTTRARVGEICAVFSPTSAIDL